MNIRWTLPIVFAFAFPHLVAPVQAQLVPGTGQEIVDAFDDFEDPDWNFTTNLPKSSANIDKVERHPSGFSNNRTFLESMYRGTPDFVRRIDTPAGGIPGSKGALAMQTLNSGIPGQLSNTFQQDDLIAGVQQKLGYMIPVSWTPSYTCRVYIPPFEKWEQRNGSHFGYRADCTTTIDKPNASMGRFFKKTFGTHKALEQYWPGFFIQLNLKNMSGQKEDSAVILIRSDERGHEVPGPRITKPGWWTLGMSFTPDGKVHYYAHEGVANLTARDHLYSGNPYGYKCEQTSTYFFNIVNQDDGHSWSTRWIVDDPKSFVATGSYRPRPPQVVQKPAAAGTAQTPVAKPAVPAQPLVTVQTPAAKTASTPPAQSVIAPVKPTTAAVPATSATPIPLLASKPMELPTVAPSLTPPESPAAVKPEEPKPLGPKLEEPKPEEIKPADPKPEELKPAEVKPAAVTPPAEQEPASGTSPTLETSPTSEVSPSPAPSKPE